MHILGMRNEKKTLHINVCHVKTKENQKNVAFSMFSITFDDMALG